jgi:very-short-patch-repair endonuclease
MNKTAIKNFAVWARRKLITDTIKACHAVGVTEGGIQAPLSQSTRDVQFYDIGMGEPVQISGTTVKQRDALAAAIRAKEKETGYQAAFDFVVEQVAYTWFNRLIAVRFMEINDYLPSRVRVLSSEQTGKKEPDLVTHPFDTDIAYSADERAAILLLKDQNKLDELFRLLFIRQCNELNRILPELFERTGDYTELLLTISFTDKEGVVARLVGDIAEDDFNVSKEGQVEIIGWMYQYYNTEPKQAVFDGLKKNVKITKDKIPAATQLFTPDWIVRYMVENSLGRIFISGQGSDQWAVVSGQGTGGGSGQWSVESEQKRIEFEKNLADKFGWKYYIPEAEQTEEVRKQLTTAHYPLTTDFHIEDVKILDPCMGSGHILVYAFEVLVQIYESEAYTLRDAARLILEKNLYGLDIDRRAYQLAYFSLMMKARQYSRRILTDGVNPQVYHPAGFPEGEEYGSLCAVVSGQWSVDSKPERTSDLIDHDYEQRLHAWNFKRLLAQKYDVVVTNPPYMGGSGMSGKMSEFVKNNYPDSKSDLFAVFIEKCLDLTIKNGVLSLVTMHSWMFISSYELLRKKVLSSISFETINHLGMEAFDGIIGKVVSTVAFTAKNLPSINSYRGRAVRLTDYYDALRWSKESEFFNEKNQFVYMQDSFAKIPGSPVAYWVSEAMLRAFEVGETIEKISHMICKGIFTGDNNRFLRLWYEVNEPEFSMRKWNKYAKGGAFRKWYGNGEYVVLWGNNAETLRSFEGSGLGAAKYFGMLHYVWTKISSYKIAFRYEEKSVYFDDAAPAVIFNVNKNLLYTLGVLNSCVADAILRFIAPTLNFQIGDIRNIPIIIDNESVVESIVGSNIDFSRSDWDSFETSWDFKRHPLIPLPWRGAAERRGGSLPWRGAGEAGGVVQQRSTKRISRSYSALPYNPALKQRARELRKAGNLSEVLLWQQLKGGQINGWDFDRQKIIGNYIVDFYCANTNLAIEIDGESHADKGDYDEKRDAYLREVGVEVLHIPDIEVKSNLEGVVALIRNHPAASRHPSKGGELNHGVLDHPAASRHPSKGGELVQARREDYVNDREIRKERNRVMATLIHDKFIAWQQECDERFNTLKANEEELNRIFIDIYGLQDELTPEVEDKDVTVRRADLGREIRSLISYAVGCMFGRYSLDTDGLAYAGGDFSEQWAVVSGQYYRKEVLGRYGCTELSRADCLAEVNGSGKRSISDREKAAQGGAVFAVSPDAESSCINSVKHSGGTSEKFNEGVHSVSLGSERIQSGDTDSNAIVRGNWIPCKYGYFGSNGIGGGSGENAVCPYTKTDHCPLTTDHYPVDTDNCIPITDEDYFSDDATNRFVDFVRTVYGTETLEENLDFIAHALRGRGAASREVIRNYFLKDFYKDHCKIYQKRPIYWLFDSGKQDSFKALVYIHRWNADTIGNLRVEYLHKAQRIYENEIKRMQDTIDTSGNAREKAQAEARKDKLTKQLKEAKEYDAKIAHLALARINIDLDDGVKVNYDKVQTGTDGKKLNVLGKI